MAMLSAKSVLNSVAARTMAVNFLRNGFKSRMFCVTLDALLLLARGVWLLPVCYSRKSKRYHSRPTLTVCACLSTLGLMALSPFLLHSNMSLYAATNVRHTSLFEHIAAMTLATDLCLSLLLLIVQIWRRRAIVEFLNQQVAVMSQLIMFGWGYTLLLWLRLLLASYDLFFNVPFFVRVVGQLGFVRLTAYLVNLYVQQLSNIYANLVFGVMLSYLASLRQLGKILDNEVLPVSSKQLWRLIGVELLWLKRFTACFDAGIFLILVGNLFNILANLYAMLAYFVEQHGIPLTISNYVLIISVQLCALVTVAESCKVEQRRIYSRLSELFCTPYVTESKVVEVKLISTLSLEFSILGMFNLDHEFLLFILSYATSFIVVILQFTVENMNRL